YRLSTTSAAAGSVKIRVAPAITVSTFSSVEVSGSAKPLIMGAPVAVQQQNADGTTWSTVATGTVSADGAFALSVQLVPGGTYRVPIGPAAGYVMGATPPRVVAS